MDHNSKPRRVGLSRKATLGYTLLEHNPHRKRTPQPSPPSQTPRQQVPDDVTVPPRSSSDEDSTDSELELSRGTKRRKKSHERALDNGIESGELPSAPSNIRSSGFTASQKPKVEDDEEPLWASQGRPSQPNRTYGNRGPKNIHKAAQKTPETKSRRKQLNAANDGKATGFRVPDIDGMCTKGKSSWHSWAEAS